MQITFKNYISSYIKKRCTQSIPLWLNINTYLLGSVSWYYSNVPLLSITSHCWSICKQCSNIWVGSYVWQLQIILQKASLPGVHKPLHHNREEIEGGNMTGADITWESWFCLFC